jgi:ABC-type antimicrobial peptide transport system permease subunit
MTFTVRSAGHALPLVKAVRDAMTQTAGVAIGAMETQAQRLERRLAMAQFLVMLYLLLGALAGAQATFGLYGTISQFVNRRRAEIALRLVLGARLRDVVRMVMRQTLVPVAAGVVLGVACSPLVAQVMRAARVITAASWAELLAISAGVSLLTLPAFAAAMVPVRRVMRIAPAAGLREE